MSSRGKTLSRGPRNAGAHTSREPEALCSPQRPQAALRSSAAWPSMASSCLCGGSARALRSQAAALCCPPLVHPPGQLWPPAPKGQTQAFVDKAPEADAEAAGWGEGRCRLHTKVQTAPGLGWPEFRQVCGVVVSEPRPCGRSGGGQEHGGGQGGGAGTTEGEQGPTQGLKDPATIESVTLNATPRIFLCSMGERRSLRMY